MKVSEFKSTTVVGQGSSRPYGVEVAGVSAPGKAEGQAATNMPDVTLRGAHQGSAAARNMYLRQTPLWRGDVFTPGMFGARWPGGRDPREMAAPPAKRDGRKQVAYRDSDGRRRLRLATSERTEQSNDRDRWFRRVGDRLYRDGWGVTVGWVEDEGWWVQFPDGRRAEGLRSLMVARRVGTDGREVAS